MQKTIKPIRKGLDKKRKPNNIVQRFSMDYKNKL